LIRCAAIARSGFCHERNSAISIQIQTTTRPAAPAQSVVVAPRKPEPSGLSLDEIRRIVLEILG
jgi:hypothetical protein